jgi:hypothetical protein
MNCLNLPTINTKVSYKKLALLMDNSPKIHFLARMDSRVAMGEK